MLTLFPEIPNEQVAVGKEAEANPTDPRVIVGGKVMLIVPPASILSTKVMEKI